MKLSQKNSSLGRENILAEKSSELQKLSMLTQIVHAPLTKFDALFILEALFSNGL